MDNLHLNNLHLNHLNKEILFMKPVFKRVVWGGNRLGSEWGYEIPGNDTGECWAVSAHPNGDCTVMEGTFAGMKLSRLWTEQPQLFGSGGEGGFPLIVKIIDACDDLSIQVHPGDDYAKRNEEGSLGKTECWYVLDAPEGAALVIGHNARDKAELEDMVRGGKWEEFLREVPVKKGDFIQIEPGTVHAIKGGIEIFETQQSSDITYRVYDYGRLQNGKPRELHIEKSIDVINVPAKPLQECIINVAAGDKNTMNTLVSCGCFNVWKLDVEGEAEVSQDYPFLIMSVIGGEGSVDGHPVKKGSHFILPYNFGVAHFTGTMEIIVSTVN